MNHSKLGQKSDKSSNDLQKQHKTSHTTAQQVNGTHPATLIQRAKLNPNSLNADDVLRLQQTIGNRAATKLLAGRSGQRVQAKLTIGEPDNEFERQADRVAALVVKQIHAPVSQQAGQGQPVQRELVSDEEKKLQMKRMFQMRASAGGMTAQPEVEGSIQQARGRGQPLADKIREPMEQAFGVDFRGVRIHNDSQSDQLNRSIQARAFTTGHDIFFSQGEYNPKNRVGQELLAHELTHVVQQKGGADMEKSQKEIMGQTEPYAFQCLSSEEVQRGSNPSKVVTVVPKKIYQNRQITNTVLASLIRGDKSDFVTHGTKLNIVSELRGEADVTKRTNPGTTGDRVHFLPTLKNFQYGNIIWLGRKSILGGKFDPYKNDYYVSGRVSLKDLEGFYFVDQFKAVEKAVAENRDVEEAE